MTLMFPYRQQQGKLVRQDHWGQHALQDFGAIMAEDQLDVHELADVVDFDEPEVVTVGDIETMSQFLGGLPMEAVLYTSGGISLATPRRGDARAEEAYEELFSQYMEVLRADTPSLPHKAAEFRDAHHALVNRYYASLSIETLAKLLNMLADVQSVVACRLTDD